MPFTFKLSKRLALMKASLVPAAAAVLAACQLQDRRGITDPTLPSNSVVQVVTVPDTVTLEPSQTEQFRVFGRTEAGDSVSIAMLWSTTDGAISSSGLYRAGSVPGGYVVTAAANGITGTAILAVSDLSVASVAVSPAAATISVGSAQQLGAVVKDANGNVLTGRTVTWTTSSTTIATVSASGLVTGVAVGSATITATSEGQSGTASVTVFRAPVASVTVSPATANVFAGATTQLSATLKDAAGNVLTGRAVAWTSSNTAIATVSAAGLVTGVAAGSAM